MIAWISKATARIAPRRAVVTETRSAAASNSTVAAAPNSAEQVRRTDQVRDLLRGRDTYGKLAASDETSRQTGVGLGAYAMGLAFAFGWTPCIGPVLAGGSGCGCRGLNILLRRRFG